MDLLNKVALVTGGSRGIGRTICHALAAEGSAIAVNYVAKGDAANKVVIELEKMGVKARAFQANVANEEEAANMVEQIMSHFGRIDVLVNNAGITRDRSFVKMTPEQWREVLHINLDGMFNLSHRVLPQMIERQWGRIISIASIVGQMGNFGQTNYATTKGGMIAFTKALAREVARKGVTVNAVAPGFIATDMVLAMPPEAQEKVKEMIPVGRLGEPEEVARAVRFLAAPQAAYITGQVININGGMYM